jgi:prepilin-type N-terminal cleavage/methylation domain-containing protein
MDNRKLNNNGFTLVELLAIIVVLAVIMLMAVQAVIPTLNKARMQSFALEAQTAIEATQTYLMNNSLLGSSDVSFPTTTTPVCVTIKSLVDAGLFEAKNAGNYVGGIEVTKSGNNYLYKVYLTNGKYYIDGGGVKDGANVSLEVDDGVNGDVIGGDKTGEWSKTATSANSSCTTVLGISASASTT